MKKKKQRVRRLPRASFQGTLAVRGQCVFVGGCPLFEVLAAFEGKNVRATFQVVP